MNKETKETFVQRRHTSSQEVCESVLNITGHQGNANQSHSRKQPPEVTSAGERGSEDDRQQIR
jgi:hypothetical protein